MQNALHKGQPNLLVILGATASGKTRLGVRLAAKFGGEIVSADSRQVYRGLNLGAGKDLDEYQVDGVPVPYHLIDIVDLEHEFNVFEFQRRFYEVFESLESRGVLPVVVGGTGLYVEAVLKGYRMVEAPENPVLRAELASLSQEARVERLMSLKGRLHNTTDLTEPDRLIRAIEIAEYSRDHEPPPAPRLRPIVMGTEWDRAELRRRIGIRLRQRFDLGMIHEVEGLHARGIPWERLERLGLEYGLIAEYLQGKIFDFDELFDKLYVAICQFAKRQLTWFRRMERNGTDIAWIPRADAGCAERVVKQRLSAQTTG